MYRLTSVFLLGLIAIPTLAGNVDDAIALEKRQSVNLSTNGSATSGAVSSSGQGSTSIISEEPSTVTVPASTTQSAPDQNSTPVTSSTIVISRSSIEVSTIQITSTIPATNSAGSTTGSQSVVTSTSSASYVVSYSQIVTASESQVIYTYTSTSNGVTVTGSRTSSTLVSVTTSARVTASVSPSNSGSHSSSGLSSSSKKIIGGVVGGVGGALLLGALAYTAWRIWGNKKNLHDDDLYDPNQPQEKLSSSTDNTPFRSTLDQYHQPGPVNTASNF